MPLLVPRHLVSLLREVVSKRKPELSNTFRIDNIEEITDEQYSELQDLLLDEFCETGLQADNEPNQRGLQLEDLIDCFGPGSGSEKEKKKEKGSR